MAVDPALAWTGPLASGERRSGQGWREVRGLPRDIRDAARTNETDRFA